MVDRTAVTARAADRRAPDVGDTPPSFITKYLAGLASVASLSKLLRGVGAVVLLAGASSFLFQHWHTGNDIHGYLALLAQTVLLSAAGLFCGFGIREDKGARTFLSLSLAVIPVNFAVLGGLIYSQFSWGGTVPAYPRYATWVAPSAAAAVVTATVALCALLPASAMAFLVLARRRAALLTGAFVSANAMLLLPTREPDVIAVITGLTIVALGTVEVRWLRSETTLNTFEGRVARLIMVTPVAMLVGRSLQFYDVTWFLQGTLWASAAFLMFTFSREDAVTPEQRRFVQELSALPVAVAWWCYATGLMDTFTVAPWARIPMVALPYAALLIVMSIYGDGSGARHRRVAAAVATGSVVVNLLLFPGPPSSFLCLLVGMIAVVYGCTIEQKVVLGAGVVGMVVGLGYYVYFAIEVYSLSRWGSLCALGMAIIVLASVVERQRNQLVLLVARIRTRVGAWGY